MTTRKAFSDLTPAGQKARLTKYAKERAKYGLIHGLFRVTRIKDHGVIDTKFGKARSLSYLVTAAGDENNEEGLKNGNFVWMNELVNLRGNAKVALSYRDQWIDTLNGDAKSILVSVDYKLNKDKGYRDVNQIIEVTKKAQPKQQTVAKAQPQTGDAPF